MGPAPPPGTAKDVCPHCGAVLDVYRAMKEDEEGLPRARRHQENLPPVPDGGDPAVERQGP